MGKTVGIIGYGNNGKETAKRFKAFGCKVLAFDKYLSNYTDEFVEESTIERIFEEVEIVSLHIPLTNETNKMGNADFFSSFKKDIFFVNASRGETVSLKDLSAAIGNGKVRGACLDVLENEKIQKLSAEQQLVFQQLIASDRVVFRHTLLVGRLNRILESMKYWLKKLPV